jgi:hypothetical protein
MTLNFHMRHEVTPERTFEVLQALAEGIPFDHVIQFDRQVGRLRKLGLVEGIGNDLQLTPMANELLRITDAKPQLVFDLMHYSHYTLWTQAEPLVNAFAWTYQALCCQLFEQGERGLESQYLESTVTRLIGGIRESSHFAHAVAAETKKGAISLSTDSLNGVLHWLRPLRPPVIEGDTFTRRHFCPPELLLLALGHAAQQTEAEIGIDLLLTTERRDLLCRVCLLDPAALDRVLDWMLPLYPEVVEPGTRTGAYGRFVQLRKMPELNDLEVER